MEKLYGINEIYKKKLFLTKEQKPYKTKVSVIKIVNSLKYNTFKTKFGLSKGLTIEQINNFNKHE